MMDQFAFNAGIASDDEYGSEGGDDFDGDEGVAAGGGFGGGMGAHYFYDSDSDDGGAKRVVETKEKKMRDAFAQIVEVIKQKMKINDWVAISKEYDNLNKEKDKWRHVLNKHPVPRAVIRTLVRLDIIIQREFAEQKKRKDKKGNAANFRALTRMRQRFRKDKLWQKEREAYLGEDSKHEDTETEVEEDDEEEEWSEDEFDEDEEEEEEDNVGGYDDDEFKHKTEDDDFGMDFDNVDDIDFGDQSDRVNEEDDDSGDEDDSGEERDDEDLPRVDLPGISQKMRNRDFWVLRTGRPSKPKPSTGRITRQRPTPEEAPSHEEKKPEVEKQEKKWTEEMVRKKHRKYESLRGRNQIKGVDARKELEMMLNKCEKLEMDPKRPGPKKDFEIVVKKLRAKIACTLLGFLFDSNLNQTTYLKLDIWHRCVQILQLLVKILKENIDTIRLVEGDFVGMLEDEDGDEDFDKLLEENQRLQSKAMNNAGEEKKSHVDDDNEPRGNLFAFISRLNNEYKKSLQQIDQSDEKYELRLNDLPLLRKLVAEVRSYYNAIGEPEKEVRVAVIQLSHMYDTYDGQNDLYQGENIRRSRQDGKLGRFGPMPILTSSQNDEIAKLCEFIYVDGTPRHKTHAILMRITNDAIHNRYFNARDMLLMSHFNDSIHLRDIHTQILFNRAQAHIAVCAFRHGFFEECMNICAELYSTGHIKECLAQGVTIRWNDRDQRQEAIDKAREYPAHQHISLDLLEAIHLISAMFLEVPNIAKNGVTTDRRNIHNRNFRLQWDRREKALFASPPENTRDFVMASAKAMFRGDWKECQEHIANLKMWSVCSNSEKVQELVNKRIREVSLETYLVTYGSQYTSISLKHLSTMFNLSEKDCHRLVSAMLVDHNCPIKGNWDQPSQTLSIFSQNPNLLQQQAFDFADKIKVLLDNNKSVLETRFGGGGGGGFRNDHRRGGGDRGRDDNRRGGGGRGRGRDSGGRRRVTSDRFRRDRFQSFQPRPTRVGGRR